MSNHQSIYDTPVIFASLPYQLRIIAKESLARFPVLGWHLRRGGHLFVDRTAPGSARAFCGAGARSCPRGCRCMIYAEGTRSADGQVARFKAGSFLLAIEAGLPIVPLAVIGTRQVMPKGRLRTEPADVTLIVHDPIQPPALDAPTVQRREGARRPRPRHRRGDRRAAAVRDAAPVAAAPSAENRRLRIRSGCT